MDAHINWLEASQAKAKAVLKANLAKLVAETDEECFGSQEEWEALPPWQKATTTKAALHVSPTGAAILPKLPIKDDDLKRVTGWRNIIKQLAATIGRNVEPFLHDVVFQHAHSTNGHWNTTLGRWERWGVRSVKGWCFRNVPENISVDPNYYILRLFSRSSFHNHKDKLIELGLIEAESCLWKGKTHLWIKPAEELARIMFEPGYWGMVKDKYLPATKKKPRGFSLEALRTLVAVQKSNF